MGEMMTAYHASLEGTLVRYDYLGRRPTLAELEGEVRRLAYFRVGVTSVFLAFMTANSEIPMDMELVLKTQGMEGHKEAAFLEEAYKKRTGPDFLDLIKLGVL